MISGFGVTTVLLSTVLYTEYFRKLMQIFHLKRVSKEKGTL